MRHIQILSPLHQQLLAAQEARAAEYLARTQAAIAQRQAEQSEQTDSERRAERVYREFALARGK